VALRNLPAAGYQFVSSRLRPGSTLSFTDEVAGAYQRFYDEGYAQVLDDIKVGSLTPTRGIHINTFVGQQVDDYARLNMRGLARQMGWGDDVILINRRLPDAGGTWTVPDILLPQHNLILDGSIGIKSATTPQVIGFRAGAPGVNVHIVRPTIVGPRIYVGP
jgi:hypothetical protein